ncbi:MAG: twin transmembrane helix small protein [Prolixibacteraceae bacterium]|nr:twin transmembrane helix small protein [Burkholderiales bacterium]
MRYVVIAFLVIIVLSLGSAMLYLIRDKGKSDRTVKALTVRVALSVTLFLLLMIGHYFGIFPKSGL